MIKSIYSRLHTLLLILAVAAIGSSSALGSATITIDAGPGFSDSTPAAPVGGNNGTTVGQQRLNAFNFAAGIWGSTLNSTQTIVIHASFTPQSCTTNSGVLGSAGANNIFRDFPNAPFPATWYSVALANALSNADRNGATAEIDADFNINIGTAGCLTNSPWYYGLDGNHGNGIDLVSVLLHEFSHGLGFQTFTSSSSGNPNSGFFSIYDRFLKDNSTGKLWIEMTSGERVASAINTGNLVWVGPQTTADVPGVLGTPRLRINSPGGIAGNYNVGTADFGPRLSSPGITASVVRALDPADGAGGTTTDGCSAFTNAGAISGNIAFVDRGSCNFTVKTKNAQNAGAIGVIIGNVPGSLNETIAPGMTGFDATITIPTVSLNRADADTIRGALGGAVNGSILRDNTTIVGADASNHAKMYAPNPLESGSSVSHWDTSLFPNQLMEPNNSADITHNVTTPQDLTFSMFRDIGWTGTVTSASIQLASATQSASESVGSLTVNVTRTGDTSGTSRVDYATSDTAGNNACSTLTGAASSRCDYLQTLGTLVFAPGETSKPILIPFVDDSFAEGAETFTLTLSNVVGATLGTSTSTITITDNDGSTGANPIDSTDFFVRQHYIDFLNREPDTSGFNFWRGEINSCGANAQCIELKRINVSAAFFVSIEFQETGYLVYRIYKAAFNNLSNPPGAPVPIVLSDFLRDTQKIGQGVQVNVGNWQQVLEANKQAFTLAFVQRPDFIAQYPAGMSATNFVTQLSIRVGGGILSQAEQTNLINMLSPNPSDATLRSQVLRAVAEDSDLKTAEFNKAFVLMQYFGYLRRNPNDFPDTNFDGYTFWLTKLNSFNGNYIDAEMVKAFITSDEYRKRFGP